MREVVSGDPASCSALAAALQRSAERLGTDLRTHALQGPLQGAARALQRYAQDLAVAREAGREALRFAADHDLDVDARGAVVEPWKPAPVEALARRRAAISRARDQVAHARALSAAASATLAGELTEHRRELEAVALRLASLGHLPAQPSREDP